MERLLATIQPSSDRTRLTDGELILMAKRGDEAAVRILIQRHNQSLFRIARSVVGNLDDAEDIVQEAYVKAFTRLDGFRGEAAFATWLTRIALNEALGRLRRRRTTVDLVEAESDVSESGGPIIMFPISPQPSTPEADAGRQQVRHVLEQAVDRLPDAFRVVFVLRDIEGLGGEQVAALLSLKPETVKTRLFRARRLIRKEIEKALAPRFSDVFPFGGRRCAAMADRVVERLRASQT